MDLLTVSKLRAKSGSLKVIAGHNSDAESIQPRNAKNARQNDLQIGGVETGGKENDEHICTSSMNVVALALSLYVTLFGRPFPAQTVQIQVHVFSGSMKQKELKGLASHHLYKVQ